MKRWTKLPLAATGIALFLVLAGTGTAWGQSSASASATASATIVGIAPLSAATLNDLDFGAVAAGATGIVADADAARFLMTGEPSFPVNVTFALPATLVGPAAATIPITFGPTDGLLWSAFPTTSTTFDPTAVFATAMDGAGLLEIGIKGTVTPAAGTVSGIYTGTITITVAY